MCVVHLPCTSDFFTLEVGINGVPLSVVLFPFSLVHTHTHTHTLQAMKKSLTAEERTLLSTAYEKVVGPKRFACRDSYTYNCIFVVLNATGTFSFGVYL